jgi:hypothetical protein
MDLDRKVIFDPNGSADWEEDLETPTDLEGGEEAADLEDEGASSVLLKTPGENARGFAYLADWLTGEAVAAGEEAHDNFGSHLADEDEHSHPSVHPDSRRTIHVKGHYRTTKSGKVIYVKPHTRRRR